MLRLNLNYFIFLFGIYFIQPELFAQAPNWEWAKTARCSGSSGTGIATDNSGNIYTITNYAGTYFIIGNFTLTTFSSYQGNCALTKTDANGNVIWSTNIGSGNQRGVSLAIDASQNIFVVGDTYGNIDKVFLAKYDQAGTPVWTKTTSCNYYSNSTFLTIDGSGDILICGYFMGTQMSFDAQTTILSSDPSTHSTAIFLAKYDGNGNVLWAKTLPGNGNNKGNAPTCLTTDVSGNIYMSGWFSSPTLTFASTTLTNAGNNPAIFISKLTSNGSPVWAKGYGGYYTDEATSVVIDNSGNLFLSGFFESPTLSIGNFTLTNTNSNWYSDDLFLIKFNSNGTVLWAKSKDGCQVKSSGTDGSGNVYLLGSLRDSLVFGGTKVKGANNFLAKYDPNGNELWGKNIKTIKGSSSSANGTVYFHSISPKINTAVYVTGSHDSKKIILDTCTLSNPDTTGANQAFFAAKIGMVYVGIDEISQSENFSIYPNPGKGIFILKNKNGDIETQNIRVVNSYGQDVDFDITPRSHDFELNLTGQLPGLYILEIKNKTSFAQKKLIIIN